MPTDGARKISFADHSRQPTSLRNHSHRDEYEPNKQRAFHRNQKNGHTLFFTPESPTFSEQIFLGSTKRFVSQKSIFQNSLDYHKAFFITIKNIGDAEFF
ncbi:hypothetical protein [Chloroherpeton thalassium]|uniref:hypothetical protein n=1 Tax=Chloroherpeton thalassium TaxID=100716 RepID=UPI00030DB52C|nr:hypothetical protein [Chloroherpeton thalassium]